MPDVERAVVHVLCDVSDREADDLERGFKLTGRPFAILRVSSENMRTTYRLADILAEVVKRGG